MEFNVKRNSTYLELVVTCENVNATTGLLDEKESVTVAKELIYAAEQLLPAGTGAIEHQLSSAREKL